MWEVTTLFAIDGVRFEGNGKWFVRSRTRIYRSLLSILTAIKLEHSDLWMITRLAINALDLRQRLAANDSLSVGIDFIVSKHFLQFLLHDLLLF